MGYFDFLSAPQQDPTLLESDFGIPPAPKKSKQPRRGPFGGVIPGDGAVGAELERKPSGARGPYGVPIPEPGKRAELGQQETRVKLFKDVEAAQKDAAAAVEKALAEAKDVQAKGGVMWGGTLHTVGDMTAKKQVEDVAGVLERIRTAGFSRRGDGKHAADSFAGLADDLNLLSKNFYFSDATKAMLRSASERVLSMEKARQEIEEWRRPGGPLAATPEEIQQRRERLDRELSKTRTEIERSGELRKPSLEKRLLELEGQDSHLATVEQDLGSQASRQALGGLPDGEVGGVLTLDKPFEQNFNGLGVDKGQLVGNTLEILRAAGIGPEEFDERVPAMAGLMRLLTVMDPKGAFMGQLQGDLERDRADEDRQRGIFEQEADRIEKQSEDIYRQSRMYRSELKALYAELGQAPFMQTWVGLVLYVFLGMLVGPTNAARMLGVGRNKKAIEAEIEGIKWELREAQDDLDRNEQRAFQVRMEAARRKLAEEEKQESFQRDLLKMQLNHQFILGRARQVRGDDAKINAIEADYKRAVSEMDRAQRVMDSPWPEDTRKRQAAARFRFFQDRADYLDNLLKNYTEQVAPGTYVEEGAQQ